MHLNKLNMSNLKDSKDKRMGKNMIKKQKVKILKKLSVQSMVIETHCFVSDQYGKYLRYNDNNNDERGATTNHLLVELAELQANDATFRFIIREYHAVQRSSGSVIPIMDGVIAMTLEAEGDETKTQYFLGRVEGRVTLLTCPVTRQGHIIIENESHQLFAQRREGNGMRLQLLDQGDNARFLASNGNQLFIVDAAELQLQSASSISHSTYFEIIEASPPQEDEEGKQDMDAINEDSEDEDSSGSDSDSESDDSGSDSESDQDNDPENDSEIKPDIDTEGNAQESDSDNDGDTKHMISCFSCVKVFKRRWPLKRKRNRATKKSRKPKSDCNYQETET